MKGCILLVDEVGIVKIEISNILKNYGVDIVHVKDDIELINYLHANGDKVKLILWSYISQDYADFETIKRIKNRDTYRNIPIAIISKLTDRKYIIKAIEAGVSEFIAKPYDNETVIKKIDKLLGNALTGDTGREEDDVLTYTFSDMLNREIKAASRGKYPVTILLLTVVDNQGCARNTNEYYEIIDNAIKLIRARLRDTDTVFHYGSNNIITMLPFCQKEATHVVEEKVKDVFNSNTAIKTKMKDLRVITSAVTFPDDEKDKERLLEKLTRDLEDYTNSSQWDDEGTSGMLI